MPIVIVNAIVFVVAFNISCRWFFLWLLFLLLPFLFLLFFFQASLLFSVVVIFISCFVFGRMLCVVIVPTSCSTGSHDV